jgi:hypothetical protein
MLLSVEPDGDVIGRVVEQFGAWLRARKSWDPQLDANAFQQNADRDLLTLRHESSDGREFRARLMEASPYGQWRTELTVQVPVSGTPWIALQVANSQGRWTHVPVLAGFLLDTLTTKDGSTAISSGARVVHAAKVDDLLEEICDPDRQGLLFVAGSGHEGGDFSRYVEQVERWTSQVRGLAQVVVMTPDATDEARRLLGPSHGIRSWTLRTFYPDVDPAVPADGLRHKFLTTERLATESEEGIRRLLGRTARRHAALRTPPRGFVRADRALRRLEDQMLVDSISVLLPEPRQAEMPAAEAAATVAHAPTLDTSAVEVPDTVEELLAEAESTAVIEESTSTVTEPAPADEAQPRTTTAEPAPTVAQDELATYVALLKMVKETLGVSAVTLESMAQVAAQLRNAQSVARAVEHVRTQLAEREELLAEAQDRAVHYQELYDDVQLDERIAAHLAAKLTDENRWLKTRLAEASDFEAAHGAVPDNAYTRYPENFDDLHERMPELADTGVTFTGIVRDMLAVDDVDTVGKLVATAWDALLVLADYVRARNDGAFDGSIKQYLEDTPQGYRQMPPNKFAERETAKTMASWGDQREFPVPPEVDPSRRAVMEAHFKLGRVGMASPRMYILDCWNTHKRVYVGYIGLHLRNTQTN